MSDPMTNMDAEDVLASIRRLVAETHNHHDGPSGGSQPALRAESSVRAQGPAALILTPDFRVGQDPVEPQDVETSGDEGDAEVDGVVAAKADTDTDKDTQPLILSMDQVVSLPEDTQHAPEDDLNDAKAPNVELETLVAQEVGAAAQSEDTEQTQETDWAAGFDDTPDVEAAAHVSRLSLEQRIAELETAVGAQSYEWEPDGSEDLEAEIPRSIPRAFAEPGARVLHFRVPQEEDPAMSPSEQGHDHIDDAEVIEETPAAHETSRASDDLPPVDEPEVEDMAAPEEVAADPDPSLEEELALAGYADEEMMDEEALRELVAQVIREELQGAMGERITRNVRRLVRREVQRALTLREFE
ncbi:hypothetical protein [Celeribacter baekdonensis]|uniref:hypothetical protein n=1 Tax=Celeribacter baekdonensis TaxID=875171 RepID=UPI0030D94EAB|tara:strand:- start:71561 stop:72631 length:1071 start_codon:yes stop_codon:yes gene_type:complete